MTRRQFILGEPAALVLLVTGGRPRVDRPEVENTSQWFGYAPAEPRRPGRYAPYIPPRRTS